MIAAIIVLSALSLLTAALCLLILRRRAAVRQLDEEEGPAVEPASTTHPAPQSPLGANIRPNSPESQDSDYGDVGISLYPGLRTNTSSVGLPLPGTPTVHVSRYKHGQPLEPIEEEVEESDIADEV